MLQVTPEIGILLKGIATLKGDNFVISSHMSTKKDVFGDDFHKRIGEFAKVFDTMMERKFETMRSKSLFFDEIEIESLKNSFENAPLLCPDCVVYVDRAPVALDRIEDEELLDRVVKILKDLYVVTMGSIDEAVKRKPKARHPINYPEMKDFTMKSEVDKWFKQKSKTAHPDAGGTVEGFQKLHADYEAIKRSVWYKTKLKGSD